MKTYQFLIEQPELGLWAPVLAGLLVGAMCAVLSVFVVLKRMAFVGQGVSHAAFGGVGIVAIAGLTASTWATYGVVAGFCILSALLIARLSARGGAATDTAIGIVLVASMAAGALLLRLAATVRPGTPVPNFESVLFGSALAAGWADVIAAGVATAVVLLSLWWSWRGMVFWAFDEPSAEAFGVNTDRMRDLMLVLNALAIVVAIRLVGVVLATALLIIPGAIALLVTTRFDRVMWASVAIALTAVMVGFVAGFETDQPPGSMIVLALAGAYGIVRLFRSRAMARPAGA